MCCFHSVAFIRDETVFQGMVGLQPGFVWIAWIFAAAGCGIRNVFTGDWKLSRGFPWMLEERSSRHLPCFILIYANGNQRVGERGKKAVFWSGYGFTTRLFRAELKREEVDWYRILRLVFLGRGLLKTYGTVNQDHWLWVFSVGIGFIYPVSINFWGQK